MISYDKLWNKLKEKGMKKTDLITLIGISSATLAKMGDNRPVSMETLVKLCKVFNCELSDIVTVSNKQDESGKDEGMTL